MSANGGEIDQLKHAKKQKMNTIPRRMIAVVIVRLVTLTAEHDFSKLWTMHLFRYTIGDQFK